MWLPCEIEALCISAAFKHFSPFIIESSVKSHVLTDGNPCVQALDKLCRSEFSASPRVTSFLTAVSRYQVSLQHLAGKVNLLSDFASRNAPDCTEPGARCAPSFNKMKTVVRSLSVQNVLDYSVKLPFASRNAWFQIKNDCLNLRRVHAQLRQGTRPSRKATNIRDVKR